MSEIIILTANDIHISDNGPRSRRDNYKEAVMDKLNQIWEASVKLKADAFVIAGDLFNLKNPTRNSHALNRELIEFFSKFKCPVYMIPGNHDLTENNIKSLVEQPLGVLFASKSVKNLVSETISKKDLKVSLVGIPYTDELSLADVKLTSKEGFDAQICALHIYAAPESGNIFNEHLYGYEEISQLNSDVFVIGHYHLDQGITKLKDKFFINIGSLSRGSLSDENIQHQPKYGLIRVTKNESKVNIDVEAIALGIKPAEEVFNLQKREEEKNESQEIQKFVETLIAESVNTLTADKNIENILDQMKVTKAVKDKVIYFITEAQKK